MRQKSYQEASETINSFPFCLTLYRERLGAVGRPSIACRTGSFCFNLLYQGFPLERIRMTREARSICRLPERDTGKQSLGTISGADIRMLRRIGSSQAVLIPGTYFDLGKTIQKRDTAGSSDHFLQR
jgi:hypothetical protein